MQDRFEVAVGRSPWDQELRLVYADWLEEHGQLEAAREQRRAASKKQRRPARVPMPGHRETNDTTDSSAVYKKCRREGLGLCTVCRWHEGCNGGRRPGHTSWKKSRKHRWRPRKA